MIYSSASIMRFGKYKGQTLRDVIFDRKYCKWLLWQEWLDPHLKEFLFVARESFVLPETPIKCLIVEEVECLNKETCTTCNGRPNGGGAGLYIQCSGCGR